jgi:hypothetical protein
MDSLKTTTTTRLLEEYVAQSLYTNAQEIALIIAPYFTAPLSIIGSGLILYVIWKERREKLQKTYHRLVLGMSLFNFMNSLSIVVLGHWAVPEQTAIRGASGTVTTCAIAGFFLNLVFGSMWYSFFLSLVFALQIGCECNQKCIARYAESTGHFLGFFVPLVSGSVAAAGGNINALEQLPGWCWTADYPNGCKENGEVQCLRGEDYSEGASASLIVTVFAGIIICMVLIILKVRRTEIRLHAYLVAGDRQSLQRTKETGIQALWYIGAFLTVYAPIAVMMGLGDDFSKHSQGLYFGFAFLTKLLAPLQGFLNSIIYFRRNFHSLLQEGRSLSFLRGFVEKITSLYTTRTGSRTNQVTLTTNTIEDGVASVPMGGGDVAAESAVEASGAPADASVMNDSDAKEAELAKKIIRAEEEAGSGALGDPSST